MLKRKPVSMIGRKRENKECPGRDEFILPGRAWRKALCNGQLLSKRNDGKGTGGIGCREANAGQIFNKRER